MDPWKAIHTAMLKEIEACKSISASEKEQVECAFKIAINYWEEIRKNLEDYVFESSEQEINFYKNTKPSFTAYIEYFTFVFLSLCYLPNAEPAVVTAFWEEEAKKLQKFIDRHQAFVAYYKGGCTDHDVQYFLPANYDLGNCHVNKVYNSDGMFTTSHDHLVAMLIAHEMHWEYVKGKLSYNETTAIQTFISG